MKKFLFVLFLSALVPFVASAQIDQEDTKSVKIHFRQGSSVVEDDFMENGAKLKRFAEEVKKRASDSTVRFRRIRILSSVSPEGGQNVNEPLAQQRAEAITAWVNRQLTSKVGFTVKPIGVDWSLLIELVQSNNDVPNREEVLELLLDPQNLTDQERFERLSALKDGVPYRWIYDNLFPQMRYAYAECEFYVETEPGLILSPLSERFSAAGGTGVVRYTKAVADDVKPVYVSNSDWVILAESPEGEINYVVAPNKAAEPRKATITVACYNKSYDVTIEQDGGNAGRVVSSTAVSYPAEGGNDVITYEKSAGDTTNPVVVCSASWLEGVSVTDNSIVYTVAPNTTEQERKATILVESASAQHTVEITQAGLEYTCGKPFYMSLKTNLLYDVALIPNIGAEFYLGGNFSIAGNWHYAWWKKDSKAWYWRTYGGDIALRYWLGKASRIKPLTGHHIGVYGQMITYDFELGNKGILADKWSWSVGAEYGYSLPIARRLNLDFTIGFGYHWGLFDEYLPIDGHYVWQATKRRHYFGPTKLEISLEWLIGCGNYNKDKRGRR